MIEPGQTYEAAHAPKLVVTSVTADTVCFHVSTNPARIETVPLDTFEKWIVRVAARIVPAA